MKRTLLFATLLGVSMAAQASGAAADAAPSVKELKEIHEKAAAEAAKPVASAPQNVPAPNSEVDVKKAAEQVVETNKQAPASASSAVPAGNAAAPAPKPAFISNGFLTFAVATVFATAAYKLYGMGNENQKEIAESVEGKIDQKLNASKKKKSKELKDVIKNLGEKGMYAAIAVFGSFFIKNQIQQRCNNFNLAHWLFGHCEK